MEIVDIKLKVAIGLNIFLLSILFLIVYSSEHCLFFETTKTNVVSPTENLKHESRKMVESLADSLKDALGLDIGVKEDQLVSTITVSISESK